MNRTHQTLVSVPTLKAHLDDADWVVFDCRHDLAQPDAGRTAYEAGHLPGAYFLHVDDDLSGPRTGKNGRHPLPERALLATSLRAAGVNANSQVVAYDASGGMYAARLWWLMRWLGHENVAVLDGGLPAWIDAGLPRSQQTPLTRAGDFVVTDSRMTVADVEVVRDNLPSASRLLVDARAPERYRGDVEPLDPVGGHIPGAANRFFQLNLQADGRFKPAQVLRDEFALLLGQRAAQDLIHHCGSGVSACHNLLAMEQAGLHGAALYPGSWSEWCADPARPVAKG